MLFLTGTKAETHDARLIHTKQRRPSNAKKKLDKARSDGSPPEAVHKATVDLAVAQVERYNFTTSIGIEPSAVEDWELRVALD